MLAFLKKKYWMRSKEKPTMHFQNKRKRLLLIERQPKKKIYWIRCSLHLRSSIMKMEPILSNTRYLKNANVKSRFSSLKTARTNLSEVTNLFQALSIRETQK